MLKKNFILLASIFSCLATSKVLAQEVELPETCSQGVCSQSKYLGKSKPLTTPTGTFYEFELHDRSWPQNSQPSAYRTDRQDYVHCSTQKPAIAFHRNGDPQITIHFLNPGSYPVPEQMWMSHLYYWMVCNDRIGPFSRLPPNNSIAALGYPLNLNERQVEVGSEAELRQIFGVGRDNTTQQPEPLSINSPLTLTGVGPIQVGMTVAEAQQAAGTQLIRGFNYQGCSIYSPAALDYIDLMVINNRIVRVSTLSNRLSTLSGAKVGDSKTRILELYPNNVRVTGVTISGRGEVLTYFPDDTSYSNYRMIFETNFSGQVTTIRSGQLPQVEYSEGCV